MLDIADICALIRSLSGKLIPADATGIPSKYCSGFSYLSDEQKEAANLVALDVLNDWLLEQGMEAIEMNEALSMGRQVEIY